jgi:hypothetical protein
MVAGGNSVGSTNTEAGGVCVDVGGVVIDTGALVLQPTKVTRTKAMLAHIEVPILRHDFPWNSQSMVN